MAEERSTYCTIKGAQLWVQQGGKWRVAYKSAPKAVCGALVRITSIGGDVRQMQHLAVMKARGHEFGVHPRDMLPSRRTKARLKELERTR